MTTDFTKLKQRINEQLQSHYNQLNLPSKRLQDAMIYAVCGGGKRIRALLTYCIGKTLGLPLETLDPIAMAIESLHAYTLIHDDLPAMDDDDMRRHQPSCHRAFDEATAILAGDALQSEAYALLQQTPISAEAQLCMLRSFNHAVGGSGICSGQMLDMTHQANNTSFETLKQIHNLKTGYLLGAAAELPAIAANHTNTNNHKHYQLLGKQIGCYLQIADDLLDAEATTDEIGKTAGKDFTQNKACYSNIVGIDSTKLELKDLRKSILKKFNQEYITSILEYIN